MYRFGLGFARAYVYNNITTYTSLNVRRVSLGRFIRLTYPLWCTTAVVARVSYRVGRSASPRRNNHKFDTPVWPREVSTERLWFPIHRRLNRTALNVFLRHTGRFERGQAVSGTFKTVVQRNTTTPNVTTRTFLSLGIFALR